MTRTRIEHHRPHYPDPAGHFRKAYHLEMIADHSRTQAIYDALQQTLKPEMTFCELGCGTGIFSIIAAGWCRKVYAVEQDPKMIEVAKENIGVHPHADKIELIHDDALKVILPEKVDVVFCEMMSIWAAEEPQVPVMNHARQSLLRPGGVALPMKIINLVELGSMNFRFHNAAACPAEMPLFTGIAKPAIFTERQVCSTVDFSGVVPKDQVVDIRLKSVATGSINCAVLHSYVQMGAEVVFSGSDSLMPPTVLPLEAPIHVKAGDTLRFRALFTHNKNLGDGVFKVE